MAGLSSRRRASADDGKRFCEVRAARNVSYESAPRLVVIEGESEGERVARSSPDRAVGGFFFIGFSLGFSRFFGPRGVSRWTPNMDLSWASFWEASWNDFGKVFGSQDGLKKAQDGAKTAKMASILGSIFGWMLSAILGGCLGASWGVLGSSWGRLGTSWSVLGASSLVWDVFLRGLSLSF